MRQRSLPILLVEPDVPISGTGFPRLVSTRRERRIW